MLYLRTKAQSTLEYVILIGFVVAALIAMGVYMKRGTEGKLRESADQIGEQYEARNTTNFYVTTTGTVQHESLTGDGHIVTDITYNNQTKTGNETVEMLPTP
ncbi:MAG: hypothetical protein NTX01_01100 [Candidatus Omnitrophica bacterium]|nr:hypothetical protein [Candidatus Omnitrophota bacterium]